MASMADGRRWVYQSPEGDGAGTGGAGGAGGEAGGGQAAGGGAQGGGAFADVNAARTFVRELIPDDAIVSAIPDDKAVGFATHLKSRFDDAGKQFPADWRKMIAADNPEHLKTLERFATPKALYDSYGALRSKLASGELKPVTPFPEKGTAEEQTAWRLTNGVPESPDKYEIKLSDGRVLGEEDAPMLESFKKYAHSKHMPSAAVSAALDFYAQDRERIAAERSQKDAEFRAQAEDTLRSEWGPDYRANLGRIQMLLGSAPKEVSQLLAGSRLADGTPFGNHPGVLNWLADLSRQVNPAGVVIPNDGTMAKSVEDEIASIEKVMRENRAAYNKDEKMQARLRDLYDARSRASAGR